MMTENVKNYLDKYHEFDNTNVPEETLHDELEFLWNKCSLEERDKIDRILELREKVKSRLKEKETERQSKSDPLPRYDDVFFEGVKALEEDSGLQEFAKWFNNQNFTIDVDNMDNSKIKNQTEVAKLCGWEEWKVRDCTKKTIELIDDVSLDEAVKKLNPFFYVTKIELGGEHESINTFYGVWE